MGVNFLKPECKGCPLHERGCTSGTKFTRIEGNGYSGVMIIGEASGKEEDLEALPFRPHAQAGSILQKAIDLGGMKRDDFWITNILRCRPPNNVLAGAEYEREAIDHCRQYLNRAIEELKPRAILSLGSISIRELTGFHGGKRSITYIRGYPLPGPNGIVTIPSFHPAFIIRGNTKYLGLLIKDLNAARSAAAGRLTYVIDPSTEIEALEGVAALERLYKEASEDPEVWIASDIETPYSKEGIEDELIELGRDGDLGGMDEGGDGESADVEQACDKGGHDPIDAIPGQSSILSIQFAISDTWGVYGEWKDPKIRELAFKILALPNPKVFHNGDHFDLPHLEREGAIVRGTIYDSLSMRRALQSDLLGNLQQLAGDYGWTWPWKHLAGTNDVLYGVADVCALVRICAKLPLDLDRLGMWDGYERYIREVREKVEVPWEKRGVPVNKERLDKFREELTSSVEGKFSEISTLIPPELNQRGPTKDGFSNLPEEIKEFVYARHPDLFDPVPNKRGTGTKKNLIKVTDIYRMLLDGTLEGTLELVLSTFPDLRVTEDGSRLYRHIPFNPRSSDQMIRYIKYRDYEVPKTFKEGKETTGDKLMKRLQAETGDPIIALSRDIRAIEKMRDSYTGKIKEDGTAKGGWVPGIDGRLRVVAKTNSTWQYSSKGGANVFALPKRRGDLAQGFRRCVAAEPGHLLIEFDYKAFHDLTTASLANDDRKWRTAKLDPHSYVAGWLVKYPGIEKALEMSDYDLKQYLLEIKSKYKKVRDEQAKPLNHGTNFGQSARRLYFENEEYFESEAQAEQLLFLLKRIYPKTFAWQENLLESLDIGRGKTPYLQSVWGARRWFWHVWARRKNKRGEWYRARGEDAEKALAFLPANHAHGMFRKMLRDLADLDYTNRYELVLFPHDAMVFHPPIELADECLENVSRILQLPVMELANPTLCPGGFICGVDASIGHDMGSMKEVQL